MGFEFFVELWEGRRALPDLLQTCFGAQRRQTQPTGDCHLRLFPQGAGRHSPVVPLPPERVNPAACLLVLTLQPLPQAPDLP